jgi:hypothetical protein
MALKRRPAPNLNNWRDYYDFYYCVRFNLKLWIL